MFSRSVLFLLLISLLISPRLAQEECSADDGNCAAKPVVEKKPVCGVPSRCTTGSPFYQRGGSAQAYKQHAPIKSEICSTSTLYKPASWPFSRSLKTKAPELNVNLNILECTGQKKKCCCTPLGDDDDVKIEVWQAQPNGQYSSLSPHQQDGVCRATLPGTSFSTLAPGSTGVLGGLGPGGWDVAPYGAPVVHILVTSPGHDPLLVHLPVILDRSLEQRSFFGPDWRGHAYVTTKVRDQQYEIQQWKVSGESIMVDINMYLHPTEEAVSIHDSMCPSYFYGSPSSFFLEPITVCAPSMLNFFEL